MRQPSTRTGKKNLSFKKNAVTFSIFVLLVKLVITFFLITKEIDFKTTKVNGIRQIGFSPVGLLLVIQDN